MAPQPPEMKIEIVKNDGRDLLHGEYGFGGSGMKTLECECGCDKWKVVHGNYLTIVVCSDCGNQSIAHDG